MHGKQGEAQAFFLQMGTKMRVCIRDSLLRDLPVGPWASHRCAMPCRVPYARPGATSSATANMVLLQRGPLGWLSHVRPCFMEFSQDQPAATQLPFRGSIHVRT